MLRRIGHMTATALLAGLSVIAAPGPAMATVADTTGTPPQVTNIAHRGASAYAPENTVAAFTAAADRRADMFEFDVQETRDHRLVLMHDTTLSRTTDAEQVFPGRAPWRVADFTLAEIRRLDAGSWLDARFRGEPVPTLEEALHAMHGSGLGALLEVKAPERYPGIERRIAEALCRDPYWLISDTWRSRLIVQGFDWDSMHRFHTLVPSVPIGLLGTPSPERLPELAAFADEINPTHEDVSGEYVDRVHKLGMKISAWTLDDPAAMRRVIADGVDGVITNRPDVLAELLTVPRDAA
ncbi:MAG: glycerophosphodiester phosphodiesterase [Actinomadura sp.]